MRLRWREMTIYAATTNEGKLREFSGVCEGEQGVEVLALPGIEAMPEPVEDAATFMGNAEKKAVAYSKLALAAGKQGLMVFADDSGLEVDALGGEPGVRSARFADDLGFEVGRARRTSGIIGRCCRCCGICPRRWRRMAG